MPNTFRNVLISPTTLSANSYTANAGVTAIIIGAQASNITTGTASVSVKLANSTANTHLANSVAIPVNSALGFISGKLVMQAGDALQITAGANSTVQVTLSILEIT